MAECIATTEGMLVEFIGDAILAVWPSSNALTSEVAATLAAVRMQDKLKRLNRSWTVRGFPLVRVRIGIGSGKVYSGSFGYNTQSGQRLSNKLETTE